MAKSFQRFLATLLALVMLLGVTGIDVLAGEVAEIPRGEEVRAGTSGTNSPRSTNKLTLGQMMAQSAEQPDEEKTPVQIAAAQTSCTLDKTCTVQKHFVECPKYSHDDADHEFTVQGKGTAYYANCEEYGYRSEKCLTCNKDRYTVAEPTEHTYNTLKNPDDRIYATCGEDRQEFYYCTQCKAGAAAPKIVFAANTKLPVHNGDGIIPEDGCPVCGSPAVAKRVTPDGTVTYHANLKNAVGGSQKGSPDVTIAQAEDGSVITLLDDISEKDIRINCSVTLDLDGKTIDGADQAQTDCILIQGATVTIQNGVMSNHYTGDVGAAIKIQDGTDVTVTDMEFTDNRAGGSGGAINVSGATLTVSNCTFTGNTSSDRSHEVGQSGGSGGAIFVSDYGYYDYYDGNYNWISIPSAADITDCKFIGNVANQYGGALYLYGCSVGEGFLDGCSFDENKAGDSGGAVYFCCYGDLTIGDTTTFTGNQAGYGGALYYWGWNPQDEVVTLGGTYENNSALEGGAVFVHWLGRLIVTDSAVFTGNQATSGCGGALYFKDAPSANISGTFTKNSASEQGGALYVTDTDWTSGQNANISGTFTGNSAGASGGAIFAKGTSVTLANGEITGNTAGADSGGILIQDDSLTVEPTMAIHSNTAGTAADDIYASNSSLTLSAAAEMDAVLKDDGRPITGWYVDESDARWKDGTYVEYTPVDGDTTALYLKAAHGPYCDIVYDLDGGTLGTDEEDNKLTNPTEYEPGISEFILLNPTKEGYTFLGWTGSNGEEPEETVSITKKTTGDLSYTANWEANEYNVIYKVDDVVIGNLGHKVACGTLVTLAEKYVKIGYTVTDWATTDADVTDGTFTMPAKDVTLTASTNAIDCTVTYDLAGGETTSEATKFTQHYGDATATIAQPTRAGYTFQGWTPEVAETVTGNATYTAQWTAIDYTVAYDLAGGATTSEATKFTQHYGDATATIAQPTRTGYTFQGWDPAVAETVTGDATYTAQWKSNSTGGSRPSRPTTPPEEDIEDGDVPLAGLPVIVPGLNHDDHVAYLIGRPDGTIAPLDNITRGEVATIFFRLLTEENRAANWSTSCSYTDTDGTEYFYNPVSTTTKAGLIKGYEDGTFGGGRLITRAEMATVAARFLSEPYTGEDLFDDIGGHWAAEYINRAATAGWFKATNDDGTKVGNFRPNDYITRAEVVVMVNRMLGRKASMEYLLPDMKTWPDNVYSESTAWYYLDIQEATNSHEYTQESAGIPEVWTGMRETPDWAAMEQH